MIAPSFADIFYNNCFKNGMLPIRLDEAQVDDLFQRAAKQPGYKLTVDLETCTLTDDAGLSTHLRRRAVPPPLPAQRPGRHRPDAGARGQDRRLRSGARNDAGCRCDVGNFTAEVTEDAEGVGQVYEETGRLLVEGSINDTSGAIVDAAMKVHTALGPGLLESAYEACLAHELRKRGLAVQLQVPMPVRYDGIVIDIGYRLDLVVDERVIVEIKSVKEIIPIHEAQLLSYLKLSGRQVGLLINFNVLHLKDGIKRLVNQL